MGYPYPREQESPADAEQSEQQREDAKHARVSTGQPAVEPEPEEDDY